MPTTGGMGACCLSGKLHTGTPVGREEEIIGLNTYISEPKDGSKEKSIVLITDIFGYRFNNTRLLADEYAKAGFYVYVPDFHQQHDSLPHEFLNDVEPTLKERENLSVVDKGVKTAKVAATLGPWLIAHREAVTRPLVEGFFNTIKMTPKTNKVGALGFCWGGRYAILMADGHADAVVACHPATLAVPGDFDSVARPTAVLVGDQDSLLSMEEVDKIKEALAKNTSETEVKVYEGQVHGFAVRGDWSDEKDKKAMDDALQQGVEWFNKHLS